MAESTQIEYSHKDLTALMLRDQGITEGEWMIFARFGFAVATLETPDEGAAPSVVNRIVTIGISRVDAPNALSVNARSLRSEKSKRPVKRTSKTR